MPKNGAKTKIIENLMLTLSSLSYIVELLISHELGSTTACAYVDQINNSV